MKRSLLSIAIVLYLFLILSITGCKTTDESESALEPFTLVDVSGYSLEVTVIPQNPKDESQIYTSINLFAAIRNDSDLAGTITGWAFQIKRDIVTILEINDRNYENYQLDRVGPTSLPGDQISELFVGTPQPYYANALPGAVFRFDPYIPTEVVLTMTLMDGEGELHEITAQGTYTFEQSIVYED